jgi:hypothetical protein
MVALPYSRPISHNYSNPEFRIVSQFLFATFSQFQPLTKSPTPSGGLHLYRTRSPAISVMISNPIHNDLAPPVEVKTIPKFFISIPQFPHLTFRNSNEPASLWLTKEFFLTAR